MTDRKTRLYYDCPPLRSVNPNHHEFGDDDLVWQLHSLPLGNGHFGYMAGVAECLVQSQSGYIELLPALPTSWQSGSFRGLCARGGFLIDCKFSDGRVKSAQIHATKGGTLKLKLEGLPSATVLHGDKAVTVGGNLLRLDTTAGDVVTVKLGE